MLGKAVRFRLSHFRPQPSPARRMGREAVGEVILPPPPRRPQIAAPQMPSTRRIPELKRPRDGVVRAAASQAASVRRRSDKIDRLDKALYTFARLTLGYGGPYVVEELIYISVQRKIEKRRSDTAAHLEFLRKRHARKPHKLAQVVQKEILPITREELDKMAEDAVTEVEITLVAMADMGRPLKRESAQGYRAVKGTIPVRNVSCYLLVQERPNGSKVVMSVKTAAEYNRSCRGRFNRKSRTQRYSQRPAALRQ